MSCLPVSGITLSDCPENAAGLSEIYITNYSNLSGVTFDSQELITALSLSGGATFQRFELTRNTSSFIEESSPNIENTTTFFTQTVTLILPHREHAKRSKILALTKGQPKLLLMVKDNNGYYNLVGYHEGAYLTKYESNMGVNKNDANNYILTFTAEDPKQSYFIDSSIISGLI